MKHSIQSVLIVLALQSPFLSMGQESEEFEGGRKTNVGLFISHFHAFSGEHAENDAYLILPAIGLNVEHWIQPKWGVGLHTDLVLQSFQVKDNLGQKDIVLDRTTPVAPAGVLMYKPMPFLALLLGGGMDISKEATLGLMKIGVDLEMEVSKQIELELGISYDLRFSYYSSLTVGFGVLYTISKT
ncbi:MAG: hypothetical protein LPK46_10845 [Bacteroidota bacterium]|nr:hypothetical protein [Bacteroidota bacterium]MDX5428940.1 hypothetical protein [Bacteroidota bacterium]MDX5446784.1 hypothetical protein [Bacteroidota bacterium]MDX5506620.1 hypothetical protein [Bacteroidota bacterium]